MGLRYDYTVDASNTKTVYARILSWATPGGRVLDVGCDTGNLASCLANLGMKAEGVEMDAEAAKKAGERLENVYVGSIEDEAVLARLTGPYDMIIFADVLEHLAYPEKTLHKMKGLLSDKGVIVASLPNVANFRVRFGLLFGRFEYAETGILDRTHLRFFTRKTAPELFRKAGFNVLDVKPAATFMPWPLLMIWPELFATRFVVKAGL